MLQTSFSVQCAVYRIIRLKKEFPTELCKDSNAFVCEGDPQVKRPGISSLQNDSAQLNQHAMLLLDQH